MPDNYKQDDMGILYCHCERSVVISLFSSLCFP